MGFKAASRALCDTGMATAADSAADDAADGEEVLEAAAVAAAETGKNGVARDENELRLASPDTVGVRLQARLKPADALS